ncbi:hypothetical protein VTH06DRAFT_597 [Thermothelomyces fergusii]
MIDPNNSCSHRSGRRENSRCHRSSFPGLERMIVIRYQTSQAKFFHERQYVLRAIFVSMDRLAVRPTQPCKTPRRKCDVCPPTQQSIWLRGELNCQYENPTSWDSLAIISKGSMQSFLLQA